MTKHFFGDTAVLTGRSLRHITRSPDTIITTAIMPIAFMLLFVYVFGGAIDSGSDSYVNYLLPGILLITIASGISYTAFRLFMDMQSGIFERFQSMPIARSSVLWAHVLTSLVANLISVVVVVLVALLMGFRSGAGVLAWLAVAGILILFTLALTWLAVIAGLSAKTVDGASAFSYPLIFLPFISSAFVPTDTMPGPVRAFAENQPVTSIVNTIRDLFAQQPVGTDIWIALAWCVGILVVAYAFAMVTYRRKISLIAGTQNRASLAVAALPRALWYVERPETCQPLLRHSAAGNPRWPAMMRRRWRGTGMSEIRIGTSGWSYDHWNNVLYEPSLAPGDRLGPLHTGVRHGRAERELLSMAAAADVPWLATSAPAGVPDEREGPRGLSHGRRLYQPEIWTPRLVQGWHELGERRGVLLVQLPPDQERDDDRLDYFLHGLPEWMRVAVELRHHSWAVILSSTC